MQGTIRGREQRQAYREEWAREVIPEMRFEEVAPLRMLIPPGRSLVAIDAGANKGLWSKALLTEFGESVTHIHMIEASPENVTELSRTDDNLIFSPQDFSRLSALHAALGDKDGTCTLYTNDDGSPLASLYPHTDNGYSHGTMAAIKLSQEITVPMRTIDDFLVAESIDHVDILKIDVEGYELQVLNGARNAIREHRIDVIAFEFGIHQIEARAFFLDFYKFFVANGYRLYQAICGGLQPVDRYEYRYEKFDDNYIFVAAHAAGPVDPVADRSCHDGSPVRRKTTEELMADLRATQFELAATKEQVRALQEDARLRAVGFQQQLEALTRQFTGSTSWRLTAPLRLAKTRLWPRR
jgi:FkbM family methyltransferase